MSKGKRLFLIYLGILEAFCFVMFIGAKVWGNDKDLVFWGISSVFNYITIWGILA